MVLLQILETWKKCNTARLLKSSGYIYIKADMLANMILQKLLCVFAYVCVCVYSVFIK